MHPYVQRKPPIDAKTRGRSPSPGESLSQSLSFKSTQTVQSINGRPRARSLTPSLQNGNGNGKSQLHASTWSRNSEPHKQKASPARSAPTPARSPSPAVNYNHSPKATMYGDFRAKVNSNGNGPSICMSRHSPPRRGQQLNSQTQLKVTLQSLSSYMNNVRVSAI